MTFVYVTGAGTDSTEKGRTMWARIKGRTENVLLKLPFKAAYMFRPGAIESTHGMKSKTLMYRLAYIFIGPLLPIARKFFPRSILTTEQIGQAMIEVAQSGYSKNILETFDIYDLANKRLGPAQQ